MSIQFSLDFSTKPPKVTKDPEPKRDYTLQKDRWEQGYSNKLFHPKEWQLFKILQRSVTQRRSRDPGKATVPAVA